MAQRAKDDAELLAEEIPDFDDVGIYEIYIYGYDKDDKPTGYEKYITAFTSEDEAIEFIDNYKLTEWPALPTVYVRVEAEYKEEPGPTFNALMVARSRVIICK